MDIEVYPGLDVAAILTLCLVTPVQFGVGWQFYVATVKGLRHGSVGMDVIISTGTSAAYLCALVGFIRAGKNRVVNDVYQCYMRYLQVC